MLMHGHDRYGHLDGSTPSPSRTITTGTAPSANPAFSLWFRQDKLIQNALMASVDPTIATTIAAANSAKTAWDALHTPYANKSQTRIFSLRDRLMRLHKDSQPVSEYLQSVRSIADELSIVGAPVTNFELIVKIISGLGAEFHCISAAIPARDSSITYEELYEKLQDHEIFLRREEYKSVPTQITVAAATSNQSGNSSYRNNRRPNNNNGSNQQRRSKSRFTSPNQRRSSTNNNSYDGVRFQLWNKLGNIANVCRSQSHNHFEAKANYVSGLNTSENPWILDSGASHHITATPQNLQAYNGMEQVSMGDGNKISITYTGSTHLNASNKSFKLSNTLCAPSIKRNLLSVSKFGQDNLTSIEFFPFYFSVKDLETRTPLVHSQSRDGLYEWPELTSISPPKAHLTSSTTTSFTWHRRLGHPYSREGSTATNPTPSTITSPPLSHDLLSPILIQKAGTTNPHKDTVSSACTPTEFASPGTSSPSPTDSAAPPDHTNPILPQSSVFPIVYSCRNKTMSSAGQNSAAHPTASIPLQPSPNSVPVTEPLQPSLLPPTRVVTRSQHNIHKPKTILDFLAHLSPPSPLPASNTLTNTQSGREQ
ncbi:hypothetical protein KY289_001548 [Solanum tuberosum]|nr:hypothetical protein KY289_001548 [Solanum tuberosum]